MPRALRTFLSCLVMLAIPLQGFAAASMILCGPHHAAMAQGADSGSHHHDDAAAPHHHPDATPAPDAGENALGEFVKSLGMKCSACSSCCSLAALPIAPVPSLTFLPTTSVAAPFFSSSYTGIVPDGLERPPSRHLA